MAKPRPANPADGVAWITGASSGIGRSVALELARRGWAVAATARRADQLDALSREAAAAGLRIAAYPGDVTDAQSMADVVKAIEAAGAPIALAFLNAGIAPYVRAPDLDLAVIRHAFEVNVFGVFNGLAALLPAMAARGGGQIAVCASVAGYGGLPKAAAYGATKAAMINAFEALKFDCDRLGILMQVVNPGFIDTPLTAKNNFPMPFLMAPDKAAKACVDGFERGRFEIKFPRRMAWLLRALNLLPYPMYFGLLKKGMGAGK